MGQNQRVWEETFQVDGVRKLWRQLRCEGIAVARCTVARQIRLKAWCVGSRFKRRSVTRRRRVQTSASTGTSRQSGRMPGGCRT